MKNSLMQNSNSCSVEEYQEVRFKGRLNSRLLQEKMRALLMSGSSRNGEQVKSSRDILEERLDFVEVLHKKKGCLRFLACALGVVSLIK